MVLSNVATKGVLLAREFLGPREDEATKLRCTDYRSSRELLGMEKLSARMVARPAPAMGRLENQVSPMGLERSM